MKTSIRVLAVASTMLLTQLACGAEDPEPVSPERAEAAREALVAWFECMECTNGELDAVARYRREVEDALIHTLKEGPSPARQAEIELRLRAEVRANGWQNREGEYIKRGLSNAEDAYRLRAISALARVGTDDARTALNKAVEAGESPRVRNAAKKALETMPPR